VTTCSLVQSLPTFQTILPLSSSFRKVGVNLYQTTRCHSSKYGSLHTNRGLMANSYQISTKHTASMFRVELLPSVTIHFPISTQSYPDDEGSIFPQSFAPYYQTTPSHTPEDHNLKIWINFKTKYTVRST